MRLSEWLEERRENAALTASHKTGADRAGWLEDEAYFAQAVRAARLTEHVCEARENVPLRMYIALRMLRAWDSGTEGFDSLVVSTVNKWVDGGMHGPVPWPDTPFFAEWAERTGYSNINGYVGFRCSAQLGEPRTATA